ncbi:retinol dehydrogenase 7 [Procambarus clarkii]|uniref:retinol dehydrogenase 7 n=1 Tax=Procambarus clarkii TaxID=6728 RepID=UPI0037436A6F
MLHCHILPWSAVAGVMTCVILRYVWTTLTNREVEPSGRIVVVTGCDSGIGYQVARSAASWGWTVVATCLNLQGEGALALARAGVHTVYLDFTKPNMLRSLQDKLQQLWEDDGKELWCLVNNAGMMTHARLEWHTNDMVVDQVRVNLTGPIDLTRALLPTIRRNKGRVVMVSSPAGQVPVPKISVYCATKWGIEGFSQSLRLELDSSGTSVVIVRPCNLPNRTGILSRNAGQLRRMIEAASEETLQTYRKEMRESLHVFEMHFSDISTVQNINDPLLMQCFRRAMMKEKPAAAYSAAPLTVRFYLGLLQILPSSFLYALLKWGVYYKIMNLAKNT